MKKRKNIRPSKAQEQIFYCKDCESCGESGCCSPTICQATKTGAYCSRNLNELKVAFIALDKLFIWLHENSNEANQKVMEKLDQFLDEEESKRNEYILDIERNIRFFFKKKCNSVLRRKIKDLKSY